LIHGIDKKLRMLLLSENASFTVLKLSLLYSDAFLLVSVA